MREPHGKLLAVDENAGRTDGGPSLFGLDDDFVEVRAGLVDDAFAQRAA